MLSIQTASFSRSVHGGVCISFDDVAFARADVVFIDPSSREVSALVDGMHVKLGIVSSDLAALFMAHDVVTLTAPHPQGHDLRLVAPVLSIH